MMRGRLLLALAWIPLWAGAAGGDPAAKSATRARIQAERHHIETRSMAEEAACYQRFAVNDCLVDSRARRRTALQDLRRQEVSLNDAERAARAAAHAVDGEDKLAGRADAAVEPPRESPAPPRLRAATDRKLAARAQPQPSVNAGARATRPASERGAQADAAQATARYEQKLLQAEQRRQKQEARAANRKKPASPPLPPAG
jgi:colicin import membrane protein